MHERRRAAYEKARHVMGLIQDNVLAEAQRRAEDLIMAMRIAQEEALVSGAYVEAWEHGQHRDYMQTTALWPPGTSRHKEVRKADATIKSTPFPAAAGVPDNRDAALRLARAHKRAEQEARYRRAPVAYYEREARATANPPMRRSMRRPRVGRGRPSGSESREEVRWRRPGGRMPAPVAPRVGAESAGLADEAAELLVEKLQRMWTVNNKNLFTGTGKKVKSGGIRYGRMTVADVERLKNDPQVQDARYAEAQRQGVCRFCWERPSDGDFKGHSTEQELMQGPLLRTRPDLTLKRCADEAGTQDYGRGGARQRSDAVPYYSRMGGDAVRRDERYSGRTGSGAMRGDERAPYGTTRGDARAPFGAPRGGERAPYSTVRSDARTIYGAAESDSFGISHCSAESESESFAEQVAPAGSESESYSDGCQLPGAESES
ncbi:hypothetical protein JKP88DRAFT_277878 [Tribonema minus]|uniref:Uncharacterized protein n=1 Tax=Tribonema minus TaxID=303371 RepID=A0A835YWL5_9STRA|nr:hypothetical protein JKP88DRAFT_277878 [Tribonema minus]